jgi:hypothetical protein
MYAFKAVVTIKVEKLEDIPAALESAAEECRAMPVKVGYRRHTDVVTDDFSAVIEILVEGV